MLVSFVYVVVCRLFALMLLLTRSDHSMPDRACRPRDRNSRFFRTSRHRTDRFKPNVGAVDLKLVAGGGGVSTTSSKRLPDAAHEVEVSNREA